MPYFPAIQQDQYPATDETQCVQIIIPAGDEFKALLAGLMVSAADVNSYADPLSPQADGLAAVWDTAYSEIDWNGCPVIYNYPTIDLFAFMSSTSSGTWTFTAQTNLPFPFFMQSPTTLPSSSGHRIRCSFGAPAGNYQYTGVFFRTTLSGIADIDLTQSNGNTVVTNILSAVDLYGASLRAIITGTFTIPDDGQYEIQVKTGTTKNPSSGGYGSAWTSHHIRRVP